MVQLRVLLKAKRWLDTASTVTATNPVSRWVGPCDTVPGLFGFRVHLMLVGSGCIHPSVVESFAWFLYISSPW